MEILRARRSCKAAVALATAGIIVASTAAAASAATANPGAFQMFANATLHTEGLALTEVQLQQPAGGTVDGFGNFVIAQPDLAFATQDAPVAAPGSALDNVTLHATIQPATGFGGIIDPEFGTMNLSGSLVLVVSADGMFTNCPVGPIPVNLQTSQSGGAPYNGFTGTAVVADATFSIPAIPIPQPECAGWEAQLNDALGLPSAAGGATLLLTLRLTPAVVSASPATTTTTATTTTVTTAPPSSTSATSAATTTAAASTTRAPAPTAQPRAAAGSPPKAPAATSARATKTTPPPTTGPPTTPPLQDRRAVVTPLTVPDTSAPAPATPIAPRQLAADPRAVSDRFLSGPAVFVLALALSGIGVGLIGSEVRAMRGPRRRRAARAH